MLQGVGLHYLMLLHLLIESSHTCGSYITSQSVRYFLLASLSLSIGSAITVTWLGRGNTSPVHAESSMSCVEVNKAEQRLLADLSCE